MFRYAVLTARRVHLLGTLASNHCFKMGFSINGPLNQPMIIIGKPTNYVGTSRYIIYGQTHIVLAIKQGLACNLYRYQRCHRRTDRGVGLHFQFWPTLLPRWHEPLQSRVIILAAKSLWSQQVFEQHQVLCWVILGYFVDSLLLVCL